MPISFTPKPGTILTCNYGNYTHGPDGQVITNHFDGHLPPEMVKNRLVMVLNGRIDANACIIVPLSTTKNQDKLFRGLHVEFPANAIPQLHYFQQVIRWAKADLVQLVSKDRLFRPRLPTRGDLNHTLPPDDVSRVQRAVIKAINASSLLAPAPVAPPGTGGAAMATGQS